MFLVSFAVVGTRYFGRFRDS